eukprot:1425876-Heterocapsa_arctica.AAC.1
MTTAVGSAEGKDKGKGKRARGIRNAGPVPSLRTCKRFTGWPSRGKRIGEAEKPGPSTYYPPVLKPGNGSVEFEGIDK